MTEPGASEADEGDFLEELGEFLECVSAHLEWHQGSGTLGLPRDPEAKARVEAQEAASRPVDVPREELPRIEQPEAQRAHARPPAPVEAPRAAAKAAPKAVAAVQHLPVVDAKVAAASLDELRKMTGECQQCALHVERKQAVFSRGTGSSKICFVGEGPGAEEDEQGEPFVGAAGQLLDKMIVAMGLSRDEVYVCNVVKCRPPNNRKPEPSEMAACAGYLSRQLELIQPEVIVALGGTAVAGLLGITDGITRVRGTFRLYQGRIPVMPTFHPAYLLRTPAAKREVWADLKAVLQHMGRNAP
jgi:uracil-DNA glycosylase